MITTNCMIAVNRNLRFRAINIAEVNTLISKKL